MSKFQKTIINEVSVSGVGLHTGKQTTLTFKPAPENFGIKFKRTDVARDVFIDANIDNIYQVSRGTSLIYNGLKVFTVEHVLAAVSGKEIDNLIIELNQEETPILDGSSMGFVKVLEEAGIKEQESEKDYFAIPHNIQYENKELGVEIVGIPSDEFRLTVIVDYDTKYMGGQHAELNTLEDFKTEIAPSRTFCFFHELESLLEQNLIKGGDLDNAIVIVENLPEEQKAQSLKDKFNKKDVVIREGILNNIELRYRNEPARHKLLDLLGDITLLGKPIKGHIIATKPGHAANAEFTKLLRKISTAPNINSAGSNQELLVKPPVFDINQIQNILPHRTPFLLIDKIVELTDQHVVGIKNVTMNEPFFEGHFPGEPVMPGVLQIEAMAQTGGIFALNTVPDPQNYITYFLKIEQARFKQKVVPGDTLLFKLELLSPIRRGICHMKGKAFVGEKVVMEAELLAQIAKKN